jgi:mycothiol synthase
MKLAMRSYQSEDDYQRIRDFLRQVFLLNDRRTLSWSVARLDYWRWHGIANLGHGALEKDILLWETGDGQIAAVLNREAPGHAFLQVHPAFKNIGLEEAMIARAEEYLRVPSRRGGEALRIWTNSEDMIRIDLLRKHGFTHLREYDEHQWRRSLELPIPASKAPAGYSIRPLGDSSELPSRSWASWRAFHSNEPDEKYDGDWKWYLNIQSAPLYRPELDLVAITSSGEVAAFTTIWYDEQTLHGEFEPVGTMPEHQRRGLARALLCEGMQRLRQSGATQCMVTGGSVPANGLYQAVLGPIFDLYQPWEKRWPE